MTNGGVGRGRQILEGLMGVRLDRWGMEPEFRSLEYQEEDFGLGGWARCSPWAVFGWWEGPGGWWELCLAVIYWADQPGWSKDTSFKIGWSPLILKSRMPGLGW